MQSDAIKVDVPITTTTPVEDQERLHIQNTSPSFQLTRIQNPPIIDNEGRGEDEHETYQNHQNKKKIQMDEQMLRVNMLSVTFGGTLIGLGGIVLYFTRSLISSHVRYVLPMPPIGVAAYVFVFNMFKYYNASLPSFTNVLIDVLLSTLTTAATFLLLVVLMTVIIWLILRYTSI